MCIGHMTRVLSIVGEPFEDEVSAQQKCDALSATEGGDEVEVDMKNGKHYKGPKYIYRVGDSDKWDVYVKDKWFVG